MFALAGCLKGMLQKIENGNWHCPLMDPEVSTIERGLQCFAQCNEGFELTDPSRAVYMFKHFEKTCRCNVENERCHWTKIDQVPKCAAARTNRIINGQTAEAHSKPYMVSVSVKEGAPNTFSRYIETDNIVITKRNKLLIIAIIKLFCLFQL